MEQLKQELVASVIRRHGDDGNVVGWVNRKFPGILDEWCKDPERLGVPIKVVRAYRRQLVCLDRRYLDYPTDWRMRAYRHKHRDDYTCNVCGKRDETCADLQAHHIIFRSRSGTNYAANIVVLCFDHHQAQHPDHAITVVGGEAAGFDQDDSMDPLDAGELPECLPVAGHSLRMPEPPVMPPQPMPDIQPLHDASDVMLVRTSVARNPPTLIGASGAVPVGPPRTSGMSKAQATRSGHAGNGCLLVGFVIILLLLALIVMVASVTP